jgi:hypothetical protein
MLELIPGLLLGALACLGLGASVLPARVFEEVSSKDKLPQVCTALGLAGMLGIAGFAWIGGAIGVFRPVFGLALWLLVAFSLLGLWRVIKFRGEGVWYWLLLAGLFVATLLFSSREVLHGDTGNYHHQAVLWMSHWQLPVGLANLHGRFGFNSSWWTFSSLFEFPWMAKGTSIYYPVGLLCFFFGLLVAGAFRRVWNREGRVSDFILLVAGYLWFRQLSGINNPSFSTDAPANLFVLTSGWALARWRESGRSAWFGIWCALAATASSFKLTALPWLAISGSIVGLTLVWDAAKSRSIKTLASYAALAVPGIVIFLTYAARGILISGYPFYPTQLFGQGNLRWAIPDATILSDTGDIRDWPTRGGSNGVVDFVVNWVQNQFGLTNVLFGGLVALAFLIAMGFVLRHGGGKKMLSLAGDYFLPLSAALIGLIVCFVYAPALRFVSGYFFLLIGILLGIPVTAYGLNTVAMRLLAVAFGVAALLPNAKGMFSRSVGIVRMPPLPAPVVEMDKTNQGEVIGVNRHGWSWAAEPPVTPYFNAELLIFRDNNGAIREFRSGKP